MMNCPRCKSELLKQMTVVINCPVCWNNLSKSMIRKKEIEVVAVDWDRIYIFCPQCGYNERSK